MVSSFWFLLRVPHMLYHRNELLFRQKVSTRNIRCLSGNKSGHHVYHVFCDSFLTSIELAKALRNKRTFFTDTIMSNRRLPATIKDAKVDPVTTYFMRQSDHLLAALKGSNSRCPVRLLSTCTAISADSSEGVP